MQTLLADSIRNTQAGNEAESILRKCVHCGFCTATCPTYQLLGDELDGPRGRIYLIKQMLEGTPTTATTREHLDRCLTCRSCETTCPSGVHYSRLLDIGRQVAEQQAPRSVVDSGKRYLLKTVLPRTGLFRFAVSLGRAASPFLPAHLARKVPPVKTAMPRPENLHARRMLALAGCVQPVLTPNTNAAAARVLDRLGISLIEAQGAGCCGAVPFHLNDVSAAQVLARKNIDAWWPLLEAGAEAVVMTASGCGVQVKDYPHLLQDDPDYVRKAEKLASLCRDISEVIAAEAEKIKPLLPSSTMPSGRVAFHSPCTLQHGQKIRGVIEGLLTAAGYQLSEVADGHLCCGSAGTYSVLQADLSHQLRDRKLAALCADKPDQIATANVGCQCHLESGSEVPVKHWIELIDERMASR